MKLAFLACVALGTALLTAGCSAHLAHEPRPRPASTSHQKRPQPVFGLADANDFVVRVVSGDVTCSGTLVDDNLVLTAHHCVSARDSRGEFLFSDVAAKSIRIELGGDDLPWADVGVKGIVAPPCGHAAGEGDIAILILDRPLVGIPTLSPVLDRAPEKGDTVNPMGFGRCALSGDAIHRRARNGGTIDALRHDRFRLNAPICPGDSGGPGLDAQGRLVGVISAAVMDGSEDTVGRAEFTRLDHWRPVFASARLVANGVPAAEVPPIGGCPAGSSSPVR